MSGEKVENRFSINFLLNRLLRLKWPQLRNGFTFSKKPEFRETSPPATPSPLARTGCLSTSSVTSTRFGRILLVTDEPGLSLDGPGLSKSYPTSKLASRAITIPAISIETVNVRASFSPMIYVILDNWHFDGLTFDDRSLFIEPWTWTCLGKLKDDSLELRQQLA